MLKIMYRQNKNQSELH